MPQNVAKRNGIKVLPKNHPLDDLVKFYFDNFHNMNEKASDDDITITENGDMRSVLLKYSV